MNGSFKIEGPHYSGVPALKPEVVSQISKDIVKPCEPAKSTMHIPVSYSSWPYGRSSPTIIGDFAFMKSGGGRLEAFHISDIQTYGLATHWEERGDRFESFKFAGEGVMPNMFDIIPKNPNFGYIEGITPLGLYLPHYSDTQMRDIRTTPRLLSADDPNREGYNTSITQNFKQAIRDTLWTETQHYRQEFTDWVEFLAEKGFSVDKAKSPGILGLGTLNTKAIAAYLSESGYLVRGNKFSDLNEIESHDPELGAALKRYAIYHEIGHHLGIVTRNNRKDERLQGMLQQEFYARQAKKYAGTSKERVNRWMSHAGREYAKSFSFLSNLFSGQPSNGLFDSEPARQFMEKFQKEAEAYGLSEKETNVYVAKRVKDIFGVFLDEESSPKEENLEGAVQNAYESLSGIAENKNSAQNYRTIDGKVVYMQRSERSRSANSKGGNESKEKCKVTYARDRFGKARYDGEKAKSDEASDRDTSDAKDSGKPKGESSEGGEAEGTGEGAKAA